MFEAFESRVYEKRDHAGSLKQPSEVQRKLTTKNDHPVSFHAVTLGDFKHERRSRVDHSSSNNYEQCQFNLYMREDLSNLWGNCERGLRSGNDRVFADYATSFWQQYPLDHTEVEQVSRFKHRRSLK